jgi:hypothetical protein
MAEARAEAATPLDRIVPVLSIAHRRFRTQVFEPLNPTTVHDLETD